MTVQWVDTCFDGGGVWITDEIYLALGATLAAPFARGAMVCSSCGKAGLTEKTAMMSESGPVCDACGLERQAADMELLLSDDDEAFESKLNLVGVTNPYAGLFWTIQSMFFRGR